MLAFRIITCKNNGCQQSGTISACTGGDDRLHVFSQPECFRMEQAALTIEPPVIGEVTG